MLTALASIVLATAAPNLRLIPSPQSVAMVSGEFPLGRHADLRVINKGDAFTAEQLIEESPTSFGWGSSGRNPLRVYVTKLGADSTLDAKLKRFKLSLPKEANDDGYILSVRPNQIICAGKSAAGTFYAVQTLKQLIRANRVGKGIPCVDIVDWPALQIRGWQDDISRGPIPTLEFLKKEVRELSEYKLNAFTLYTEHVFRLKKHPTIAPADGITAEQVKELDNYCKKYHVQLIGNFQSFGHFANILRVPGYENLKETGDVITPAKEESYAFLKDVYDEIAPSYSSTLFNINCDETYGLGEGPAKEMVAKEGLGNVYAKHINRVASLLKAHGKTPMMWGDIALQYPDIRKNLPKDLIVLTWGYDPRASFVDQIEPFTKIGFKFLVCPGVSCWGQIFPDLEAATLNISNFVRDGAKNGAMGMMNTTWDDTGENLFNNNWYPLIWGAEVSWKPAQSIEDTPGTIKNGINEAPLPTRFRNSRLVYFDDAFPRLFYGLPDGSLSNAIWNLSRLRRLPVSKGMSDQGFWALPWTIDGALFKDPTNKKIGQIAMDTLMAIQHARAQARFNGDSLNAAEVALAKATYLFTESEEMSTVPDLAKLPTEDRDWMANAMAEFLTYQLDWIKDHYSAAWRLENRPWWLDRNLAKFDRALSATKSVGDIPWFDPPHSSFTGEQTVNLSSLKSSVEVRYTVDGSEPSKQSPLVQGPITLKASAWIKAKAFLPDGTSSPTVSSLYECLARPSKVETKWRFVDGHTPSMAFDKLDETYFWSNGQVIAGDTFTVVLDDPDVIGGIKVTTGHPDHPDDYVKGGVLEVSADGEKWREMAMFDKGIAECGLIGFRVKAIRVRLTKDNGNWLVIREITLK